MNTDPVVIARRRATRWGDWSQADFELYADLRKSGKILAPEAKRLVLEHRAVREVVA
jgi:hypothetical protein